MPKAIPFDFVLDYLPANIIVKPMFGMFSLYLGKRIVLILHLREKYPEHNGIWVAINDGHHDRLKATLPMLIPIMKENDRSCAAKWLLLKEDADNFEALAITICEYISRGDAGIGRTVK